MKANLEILFEDDSLIVINKQRGLAVQTVKAYEKDAVSILKEHIKSNSSEIKGEPYVGVVHRLDQPVSGIVVFAKNSKAAAKLSEQIREKVFNKHYYALVEGILPPVTCKELKSYIGKDPHSGLATVRNNMTGKPGNSGISYKEAILSYSVVSSDDSSNTTKVDILLTTGRFHQIRAQFSEIGHPIVGDRKYGSVGGFSGGIALMAYKLSFVHPTSGKTMEFVTECDF